MRYRDQQFLEGGRVHGCPRGLVHRTDGPAGAGNRAREGECVVVEAPEHHVQRRFEYRPGGALAALSGEGQRECQGVVDYYMSNARRIRAGLEEMGIVVYGGEHAPYVWIETPNGMTSWDFFDKLLTEAHVVSTPGSGFGPSGEGYVRLSAFGRQEDVDRAVESIRENLEV